MLRFLGSTARLGLCLAVTALACRHGSASGEVDLPVAGSQASSGGSEVSGWEGFWAWTAVDQSFLDRRGVPLRASVVAETFSRVGKLVIAAEEREVAEAELHSMVERYCTAAGRPWNEDLCAALEEPTCDDGRCIYRHYGNCSGVFVGGGVFLTAAHCVAELEADDGLRERSSILRADGAGQVASRLAVGRITLGKADFDHHWVVVDEQDDPVDVASVVVDDGGGEPLVPAAVPARGEVVFIVGFPRVERRSAEALEEHGYELSHGTPAVSFGRVADRNEEDLPLCNVDGDQEHWTLSAPCLSGDVTIDGTPTWRGVITRSPFLATYDSCNGYSGGPIFDAAGRLVGINVTLVGTVDPQERFSPSTRMVAIPATRAFSRLGVAPRR